MSERDLFIAALKIMDQGERSAWLDRECGSDATLRRRLDVLLQAFDEAGSLLENPAVAPGLIAQRPDQDEASSRDGLAPSSATPGTLIGPYKLLQQIGEGGMGTVLMAEQSQPVQRKVALKIIKPGMDSRQVIGRFEAERQALAMMDHPNIAKVFDAGTTVGGRPFFVMELVKGVPITKYCDDNNLTLKERLGLFIPVCQAVMHAHQKGIIHRDLKPSNVLVARYDDKPVPKIIDFGVAKATEAKLTERTFFTQFGQLVGTLEYMSPEQATLNALDVDTRSDIYSLSVLLYELLAGSTPLDKKRLKQAAFDEMLRVIREEESPTPSTRLSTTAELPNIAAQRKTEPAQLTRLVRGELDWIVMKALDKDRNRRYETANGFAEDIQRYLADEPVLAGPLTASYRLRKFARKHKKALVTTVAFAVLLVAGVVLSTLLAVWAMAAEREADASARAAEANLYVARMNLAQTDWENANVGRILETLEHYRQPPAAKRDPRGWEWYYQDRLCQLELRTLKGHTGWVQSVAFSPDGSRLASGSADGTINVWDTESGLELRTLKGHTGVVVSVAFSPDGSRLASASLARASLDQTLKVWDTASGQVLRTHKVHAGVVESVAFSPDGSRLASASAEDRTLKVWDTASGQELRTLKGHTGRLSSVAFSPDGSRLASASFDGTIKVWDTAGGQELRTPKGHTNYVYSVAFSPDGSRLASGSADQTIKVWDTASGQELLKLTGHTNNVYSVAFSPDGSRLASGSADQTIKVWDTASGQELRTLRGHTGQVQRVAFSPDGSRLASASNDQTIKVWDTASSQELLKLKGHTNWVWSVAFSPDGSRLASASQDQTIKVWDTASGQELLKLTGHTNYVLSVAFSPDGSRLASGSADQTIKVWDTASGQELRTLEGHTGVVQSVAFSPDGRWLASASGDRTIKVWDTANGQVLRTLKGHTDRVRSVAFSRDGSRLASASYDQTIKVWDTANGQVLRTLEGHTGVVQSVAFSPDGRWLASASGDRTIKVWDTASGQELLKPVKGHTDGVWSVAFSFDGRRLASASADGTIKVWDAASGQELRTLKGHTNFVLSVAFSPDGSRLASASRDQTIHVFDVRPWTPELRRQREALGLVEYLCQKFPSKDEVAEGIHAHKGITQDVRHEALALLEVYWPRHLRAQELIQGKAPNPKQ